MKKVIFVVLDGLGDTPLPQLENKTPLEAARTYNLDRLAQEGVNGLVYTVGKGIAPESDVAVISILGYEAEKHYTGRGPLECFAAGLKIEEGDLAYRVNFATIGEDKKIIDRRVGRNLTTKEATELAEVVNKKVELTPPATFEFKNTIGHRGVLAIRNSQMKLSSEVTNTDPAYEKKGPFGIAKKDFEDVVLMCQPTKGNENLEMAKVAAQLTNEFVEKSSEVLQEEPVNQQRLKEGKLPANVILTRDGGNRLPQFPCLSEKFGIRFGCLADMPVEKGIALLTGMEIIEMPLPSGNPREDYSVRVEATISSLKTFDGLYIHLKGPDEPAHDGNCLKKIQAIEAIDEYFFGQLLPQINLEEVVILVTADHSTPCQIKAHSDDPVSLLIVGGSISPDRVEFFSEKACQQGSLKILQGPQLMPLLIRLAKI